MANFEKPTKRIANISQVAVFQREESFSHILNFCKELGASVVSKENSTATEDSKIVTQLIALIDALADIVNSIPAGQQKARYGNLAFKKVFATFEEKIPQILKEIHEPSTVELTTYLLYSFGDPTRIDYGSGHELNFIAFLLCLRKIEVLSANDAQGVVLKVFRNYIDLCRKIQMKYKQEPAGSKGVWGLDDYQFLPFYFGAAQLMNHPEIRPRDMLKDSSLNLAKEYMFLGCLKFIADIKNKAQFHEHSPTLYSLTNVPTWKKIHEGMLKMYQAEVLAKFPVIQHFYFGSILSTSLPVAPPKPAKRQDSLININFGTQAPWKATGKVPQIPEYRGSAKVAERGSLRPKQRSERGSLRPKVKAESGSLRPKSVSKAPAT